MNIFFRWDNTNHALTDFIDVDAVDKPSLIAPMTTTSSTPIGGTDIRKFDFYLGAVRMEGGGGSVGRNCRNRSKTCSIERPSIFSF